MITTNVWWLIKEVIIFFESKNSNVSGIQVTYGIPTATLQQGVVQGYYRKSYDGRTFSAFEGIPFAVPPMGNLRFQEPIAAKSWTNILVANKSYICSQLNELQNIIGSEDCLYMYIYVPKEHICRRDNFDVVVHIHGGSLVVGSPQEMVLPDYMMDKNVILVTFNYRLGAAGFLSTGNSVVFGNNGLKDQTLALKWIKQNIKEFGGNPESITITGFSSGGSSVQFHYLSPTSRGLFQRGFSSSYTVLGSESLTLIPLNKTKQLARNLECPSNSLRSMVRCLREQPIEKLVRTDIWFKPAVEKGNVNAFLPENPYKMLKDGKVYDVPWVASDVYNESLFSLDSVYKNNSEIFTIYDNFTEWGKTWLDLEEYVDEDKLDYVLDQLKKHYLGKGDLTESNGLERLNRLMTDRHFLVAADLAIRTQSLATQSPVYYYLFEYVTEDRLEFGGPPAASHGVDNKLIFKFKTNPDRLKPKDEKMMRLLTEFIAQYAKTGIPKIGDTNWKPVKPNCQMLDVLSIKSPRDIKMVKLKELAPRSLWDSLPIKENNHLKMWGSSTTGIFLVILSVHFCCGIPFVKLKQGSLQGYHKKSYDGRIYSAFEGIPYAVPPLGELRFKEPLPAPSWDGVLVANKSYICSQLDGTLTVIGSEDCLYIYVYVPKENISQSDNLDVVVHIHGGYLNIGSPYTMVLPDYVMDKNVILVALNYRLGAAGFLSTGDSEVYGNNGFKDQVLALKWVQKNIRQFGGNPNSVTITGFSAGASSVEFHYISPLSKGLFHRGWSMSYTVLGSASLTLIPDQKAKLLAEKLQCPTDSNRLLVRCLRKQPIEKLVDQMVTWFKPAVEKGNPQAFLPENPYKLLKDKKVYDLPWIASNVINESLFSLESVYKNRSEVFAIYNNFTQWGKQMLDLEEFVDPDKLDYVLDQVKKFYLGGKLTEENGLEKLNRLLTDRHFLVASDLAIRTQSLATKSPVYYYLFEYIPEDRLEFFGPPAASHGVDTKLLFKFRTNPDRLKPKDEKMMRLFTQFLEEYARTGIPKIGNVNWIPITPNQQKLNVLSIKSPDNIRMVQLDELAPRRFWDSLPIKENNHLY
ncbi:uncharacterized protein LOC123307148 [Coccinella septempunctata]|uniref:uncharacterized protein LOC123307148 n=1 Tax=Coccinella septempunctata TaxID=41139 RepID=UPI001D069C37|nr:uncharacterized protein LOC123307148 [Coccinella septempunctata]